MSKSKRFVLLLRAINVGGTGKLPMKKLVEILESIELENVRTYIQSGNAVFDSKITSVKKLTTEIAAAIACKCGFEPGILLMNKSQFESAIEGNPYSQSELNPSRVHFHFLLSKPKQPDLARLDELKISTEAYRLDGKILYVSAPDGVARSKLHAGVEKTLGVASTARNLRTVLKLREMILATQN